MNLVKTKNESYFTTNSLIFTAESYILGSIPREESSLLNQVSTIKNTLQILSKSFILILQSQNRLSSVETRTNLQLANSSTPILNRAFFVRSLRIPKINLVAQFERLEFSPMVERSGQRLIVGCSPVGAVFHPVTLYRQAWKLAVDVYNLQLEFSAMIYLLKCVNRYAHSYQENIIKIQARNADEARWQLSAQYRLLHVIAQFPDRLSDYAEQKFAKLSQNLTRCNARGVVNANMHSALEIINRGINHPLPKSEVGGNIIGTTSKNGHRTRKTCGFFTPQIPQIGLLHLLQAEFVARSIHRNKPSNRTNKVSRFFAVVEALPRLSEYGNSNLLNKENIKMLFKFLLTGKKRLTIRIRANSEQEARQQLNLSPNALCVARLPVQGGIYA